jgi:hypothetical protein
MCKTRRERKFVLFVLKAFSNYGARTYMFCKKMGFSLYILRYRYYETVEMNLKAKTKAKTFNLIQQNFRCLCLTPIHV